MKPAGLLVLIPMGLAGMADAADTSTGLVSGETKAHVRSGLPAYQPPPADAIAREPDPSYDAPTAADPHLLILPKITVKEQRLPRDAVDYLMSRRDLKRKFTNVYLDDLDREGAFTSLLNRFTLPILSPSLVARGRALERGRELDRLADLMGKEEARSLNGFYDEIALSVGRRAPKRR